MARRGELGMDRQELAGAAEIDPKTLYNLEIKGRWPIAVTRARIERALRWPPGEMERIAAENEPQPDGLAEYFGEERAARLRRVLEKRGEAGAIVLAELEREFSSPAAAAEDPGESGSSRAAS